MPLTVVLGEQRGDEGKGRFVDMLAEQHDVVARFNGGHNAGHTIVLPDSRVLDLHILPSGIAHDHTLNVIGNGCLVSPEALRRDIDHVESNGILVTPERLALSSAAHLIMPSHVIIDKKREAGKQKQGSTQSGIAPAAADKYMRTGVRAEIIKNDIDELERVVFDRLRRERRVFAQLLRYQIRADRNYAHQYAASAQSVGEFVTDTVFKLNAALRNNPDLRILAEGAQASQLDIHHGMYPYTTSSDTTSPGALSGLGLPPQQVSRVIGVAKAIPSHVGGGPFATEITDNNVLQVLHGDTSTVDAEIGTTTGRIRRLGRLDLAAIRRAQMVNGTSEMAITKLDWVPRYGSSVNICTAYERKGRILSVAPDAAYKIRQSKPLYQSLPTWQEDISSVRAFNDLPVEARDYIHFVEEQTETPITMIGVGPGREEVIIR